MWKKLFERYRFGRIAYVGCSLSLLFFCAIYAFEFDAVNDGFFSVKRAAAQGFQIGPDATWVGRMLFAPSSSGVPTVNGSSTVLQGSTNSRGQITTNGIAQMVITFSALWANAPICQVQNESATTLNPTWSTSTSALTVNAGSGWVSGNKLDWWCTGF